MHRFIRMTRRNGRRALGAVLLAMTAAAVAPAAQADAAYELRPKSSSDKCLSVEGHSLADFANVVQWTCNGLGNQVWDTEHAGRDWYGRDYYRLKARHSGKCLDVEGGRVANEANVQQYGCHWGDNQQWRFEYVGGYYRVIARHSGKCLDVYYGSSLDGENVQQWTCWDGPNQLWQRTYKP